MDIEDWRKEIDRIDEDLVHLINRRSTCAIEIGRIKKERGLPAYAAAREATVLNHVAEINKGPLESEAIRRVFERIIDEARSLERHIIEREAGEKPDLPVIDVAE
ncbi:MAG TPA: chorismate mutase [Blastocatellia bacterium]